MTAGPDIVVRRHGAAGRITINRPRKLNALTGEMVAAITAALAEFAAAPSLALIILDSASPRAFSAGGDVLPVWNLVRAGHFDAALAHCRAEYALDLAVARSGKPVVALIDGLVMGGGIGISCHAAHPVITERAALALPECAIGFAPDSGITAILAGAPGRLAEFLAFTGRRIGPGEMLATGFGRHFVRSACLPALIEVLALSGDPGQIAGFQAPPPAGVLAAQATEFDAAFGRTTIDDILAALDGHPAASWQQQSARAMRRASPAALAATLGLLRRVRRDPRLESAIAAETATVAALLRHPDFLEGVRAANVDRNRKPRWQAQAAVSEGVAAAG